MFGIKIVSQTKKHTHKTVHLYSLHVESLNFQLFYYLQVARVQPTAIFTVVLCILMLSKFYYQPMHKSNALKGVLNFTLKMLQHVSV